MNDQGSNVNGAGQQAATDRVRQGRPIGLRAVAASFFSGLMLALILTGLGTLVDDSLALAFLLGELGFLLGVVLYLVLSGRDVGAGLRLGPAPSGAYGLALQMGFALLLANLAAAVLLGPPEQDVDFVLEAEGLVERAALAIGVALAAPFIEEALFRGLLQGVLEKRLRHWFAIAVTGLAFGLMHGRVGALFFFFWSLPVGWMTWRIGSIRPAIVVHAVNNVVGLTGLWLTMPTEPETIEYGRGAQSLAVTLLLVGAYWALRLCVRLEQVAGSKQE